MKQASGYLDIAQDKHLFFWFFEARHNPETAPFTLWYVSLVMHVKLVLKDR